MRLSSCGLSLLVSFLIFTLPTEARARGNTVAGRLLKRQLKPLDETQIEDLVKNRTPDTAIASEIRRRGIIFRPGPEFLEKLRQFGAGTRTLETLVAIGARPPATRAVGGPADEAINSWLSARGYTMYEPLGVSLPPATVFIVNGVSAELVMLASEVIGKDDKLVAASALPQSIRLPAVDLRESDQLPFLPNVDVAALHGLGANSAVVQLASLRAEAIPLSQLQDAIKAHPKLKEKVKAEQRDMLIVFEALRANEVRLTLLGGNGVPLGDGINPQRLQAALGPDFRIVPGGTHTLSESLSLGIKAAGLSSVSTVLGGGQEELRLKEIPAEALRPLFRGGAAAAAALSSGYQVFGLVIGQGNYGDGSDRVGGMLPGAPASANLAAENFRRLAGPDADADVQTIVSRKGLVNFDKARPLTKQEIADGITKFVEHVRRKADPAKHSVVLLYYFGHGLADEKLHTVYLVPEGFRDDPKRPVAELDEGLLSVDWVRDRLEAASDTVVMLVDACRKLDGPDDLERLREKWGKVEIRPPLPVGETVDVFKFMGGLYGPQPMLFGSEDGTNAPVVSWAGDEKVEDVGPLSLKLQLLFDELTARGQTLSAADFIRRMSEPSDVTLADGKKLRAYTALRKDFLEGLPAVALVSAVPRAVATRSSPYVPPERGVAPEALPPGKTAAELLSALPRGVLLDFVFVPASRTFYMLDDQYNIFRWSGGMPKPSMIWEDKEVSLPVIGGPTADGLYLYLSDVNELHLLTADGRQTSVGGNLHIGFFGRGLRSDSVIAVSDDATVGTADPVYRLTGGKSELIASFDTSGAFDLVEWRPGELYFSVPGEGTVYAWSGGERRVFKSGLKLPAALAATERYLYCLSRTGELIYRMGADGKAQAAAVPRGPSFAKDRRLDARGLYAVSDGELYYTEGPGLFLIKLKESDWQPVMSKS